MAVDFSKLGKTQVGGFTPPPVAPAGTYFGTITKWAWAESRWKNKETNSTEAQVHFTIKPTEFGEDIDEAERVGVNLREKIFIAEQGAESGQQHYYLQELLKALGLDVAGKTFDELLPQTIGTSVMFDIVHRVGERGTIANVRKLRARIA